MTPACRSSGGSRRRRSRTRPAGAREMRHVSTLVGLPLEPVGPQHPRRRVSWGRFGQHEPVTARTRRSVEAEPTRRSYEPRCASLRWLRSSPHCSVIAEISATSQGRAHAALTPPGGRSSTVPVSAAGAASGAPGHQDTQQRARPPVRRAGAHGAVDQLQDLHPWSRRAPEPAAHRVAQAARTCRIPCRWRSTRELHGP